MQYYSRLGFTVDVKKFHLERRNVMDQFNPGLRNLVNLGKSYEKSVSAMTFAGKLYFDAVSKIGENAAVSPVSRELGGSASRRDHPVNPSQATYKRYQMEHKMKQDSLERSQSELKKLRRKSQGKNAH
ncbi:hypothetical protein NHX12_032227, partial [Muraenolepis orangiensis]